MTDGEDSRRPLGDFPVAVTGTTTIVRPQQTVDTRQHEARSAAAVELSNYLDALSKVDGLGETVDDHVDGEPLG